MLEMNVLKKIIKMNQFVHAVLIFLAIVMVFILSFWQSNLIASDKSSNNQMIELKEAQFYIEYNNSAKDAGVQVFLDGDEWEWIEIYDPDGKKIYRVDTGNNAKQIGINELFFESSEPSFDELPFEDLLALYPEGEYKFIGKTIEGDDIKGEATFTHNVPAGSVISPAEGTVTDPNNTVISWQPVTEPQGINIISYEVIVERENPLRVLDITNLPSSTTKVTVPAEFLEYDTYYEFEVLVKEVSGNQTITEGSFKTMASKR